METRTFTITFEGVSAEQADRAVEQMKNYAEIAKQDLQNTVTTEYLASLPESPVVGMEVEVV